MIRLACLVAVLVMFALPSTTVTYKAQVLRAHRLAAGASWTGTVDGLHFTFQCQSTACEAIVLKATDSPHRKIKATYNIAVAGHIGKVAQTFEETTTVNIPKSGTTLALTSMVIPKKMQVQTVQASACLNAPAGGVLAPCVGGFPIA